MALGKFIKKRKHLIWWTENHDNLEDSAIVEAVLTNGDWDDVQKLIKTLGIKKVAKIFREKSRPSAAGRQNYPPKTKRYFSRYFDKYA